MYLHFFVSFSFQCRSKHEKTSLIYPYIVTCPLARLHFSPYPICNFFFSFFLIVTVLFLNGLTKYLNHGFGLIFSLIYLKLTCRMFLFIMIMFAAVHIFSNAYWITNDIAFPFIFFSYFFMYIHFL